MKAISWTVYLETLKGGRSGTLQECLEWQQEYCGAMASLILPDGEEVDVSTIPATIEAWIAEVMDYLDEAPVAIGLWIAWDTAAPCGPDASVLRVHPASEYDGHKAVAMEYVRAAHWPDESGKTHVIRVISPDGEAVNIEVRRMHGSHV